MSPDQKSIAGKDTNCDKFRWCRGQFGMRNSNPGSVLLGRESFTETQWKSDEWENPFLFRIEGTTGIPCERTARSHVHFDTNFEDSWVRYSAVTSRMIRGAGFCEVLNANRERQN